MTSDLLVLSTTLFYPYDFGILTLRFLIAASRSIAQIPECFYLGPTIFWLMHFCSCAPLSNQTRTYLPQKSPNRKKIPTPLTLYSLITYLFSAFFFSPWFTFLSNQMRISALLWDVQTPFPHLWQVYIESSLRATGHKRRATGTNYAKQTQFAG